MDRAGARAGGTAVERVTRQECVGLAVALALGTLVGPPPTTAQVPLTCLAQAGSIGFRFEPAVFDEGTSAWSLLSTGGDPYFYESAGFDQVAVQGGGSVKLRTRRHRPDGTGARAGRREGQAHG